MYRFILYVLLFIMVVRSLRRLMAGVAQGMGTSSSRRPGPPDNGVKMARDPVCGTFVVPGRALAVHDNNGLHHFCSSKCRDAFVAERSPRTHAR